MKQHAKKQQAPQARHEECSAFVLYIIAAPPVQQVVRGTTIRAAVTAHPATVIELIKNKTRRIEMSARAPRNNSTFSLECIAKVDDPEALFENAPAYPPVTAVFLKSAIPHGEHHIMAACQDVSEGVRGFTWIDPVPLSMFPINELPRPPPSSSSIPPTCV